MSDVYMPGLKSRFNSEKIIDDLMKIERVPRDKAEKNIENLSDRKIWWQDLGGRVSSLRESARTLFSFQNPFNERVTFSSNERIITATATREADEQEYQFAVKQLAQADRFLSPPLDEKMNVEAGTYTFSLGKEEVSFNFRGGSLRDFIDVLNRQGRGKISASLMTIQPGTRSLLLESKVTGAENRLGFSGDSAQLAVRLGIVEAEHVASAEITGSFPGETAIEDTIEDTENTVAEAAIEDTEDTAVEDTTENTAEKVANTAPPVSTPVSFTYKPIKAISTAQDAVIEMEGIEITRPSNTINDIIPGVTVTVRGVSERPERLEVRPDREGVKDAIISMIGNYNRLMAELNVLLTPMPADVPGADASSRRAAALRIIDELTYLDKDEAEAMRQRLGAFAGDTTLTQFKANLSRAVTSLYATDDQYDLSLLAQIGISTNPGGSGGAGYNPSRLRGYLNIDEKVLDAAMEQNLPAIRQLFAFDTNGDLLADTGVAFNLDAISRPFDAKELGGIISLKTGTLDSRISQDKRRIDTMERQLAAKEADLKIQYSRMESAYDRMERMSTSLDNFSQQNNNNR